MKQNFNIKNADRFDFEQGYNDAHEYCNKMIEYYIGAIKEFPNSADYFNGAIQALDLVIVFMKNQGTEYMNDIAGVD